MKDLRQLIGRAGFMAAGKKRRSTKRRRSDAINRRLRSETLEKRNLLAGGILASQNLNPVDVDDNGRLTARDALLVVNFLARSYAEGEGGLTSSSNSDESDGGYYLDVNGDGTVSAVDALGVINALNFAEGESIIMDTSTDLQESVAGGFQEETVDLLDGQMAASGREFARVVINTVSMPNALGLDPDGVNVVSDTAGDTIDAEDSNGRKVANLDVRVDRFAELNGPGGSITAEEIVVEYAIFDRAIGADPSDPGLLVGTATKTINILGATNKEVEYIITARDLDDQLIEPTNGVINVAQGQEFFLQISVEDLRPAQNDGIFYFTPDIVFDLPGDITPVLFESQSITLNDFDAGTNGYIISIPQPLPGNTVTTFEVSAEDANDNDDPKTSLSRQLFNALIAFGYENDFVDNIDFEIVSEGDDPSDPPISRVIFNGDGFGNVDQPNLMVQITGGGNATADVDEIGVTDGRAVRYSIDFRSNTAANPILSGFGTPVYNDTILQPDYDDTEGFLRLGMLGISDPIGPIDSTPANPFDDEFIPVDAFSVRVKIDGEATVNASVRPSPTAAPIDVLGLYRYDSPRIAENVLTESPGDVDELGNGFATITLSTEAPNNAPTLDPDSIIAVRNEDEAPFTIDLTQFASDVDGDPLTVDDFMTISGNDVGITYPFEGNPNIVQVDPMAYGSLLDETGPLPDQEVIEFTYVVEDDRGGQTPTASLTVTILGRDDANESPVVTENQVREIAETASEGDFVGAVLTATDPENDPLVLWSIVGGNTNDAFRINNDGQLIVNNPEAIDVDPADALSFDLSVQVQDDEGSVSSPEVVTVNITPVDEAPFFNAPFSFDLQDTTANGSTFGTLSATDPELQTLEFELLDGGEGDIEVTSAGVLQLTADARPIKAVGESYTLSVEVRETGGLMQTDQANITVTVIDFPVAPVVTPATFNVDENSADDTVVGTVIATDANGDTGLTYSIDTGTDPAVPFSISSESGTEGQITVDGDLDFETTMSYTFDVVVTDPGGLSGSAEVTVNVLNVNEAPVLNVVGLDVNENEPAGTTVGTITADDPEDDALTFSIIDGLDSDSFDITDGGLLTTTESFDFETRSTYTISVRAEETSEPTHFDTQTFTITINDVNDPPQAEDIAEIEFTEDQVGPFTISLLELSNATDPDAGDQLSITGFREIGDAPAQGITAPGTDGIVTINPQENGDMVGGERINTYEFDVSDLDGETTTQMVSIKIVGINDPPNAADDSAFSGVDQLVIVDVFGIDGVDVGDDEVGTPVLTDFVITEINQTNGSAFDPDAVVIGLNSPNDGEVSISNTQGFEGDLVFTYTIADSDLQGAPTASAEFTITYRNFVPSVFQGMVFEDYLENGIDVALNGADEIRTGEREGDEAAIAGLTIRLTGTSDLIDGPIGPFFATTDLNGEYMFGEDLELPPGEYQLELMDIDPDLIDPAEDAIQFLQDLGEGEIGANGILYVGSSRVQMRTISDLPDENQIIGGQTIEVDWRIFSKDAGLDTTNLISSGNSDSNLDENGDPKGVFALLDENGQQVFLGVLAGYEDADEVNLSYDHSNDQALLEVVEDGVSRTRVLTDAEFELTDGDKIQVVGGIDDLFASLSDDDDALLSS
ncbi:MAG: Ig-like domain-containing protein [Planctomycetota bacterium]